MFDCSHLGCTQRYTHLAGIDCTLAGRIEDTLHIAGHPVAVGNSFDSQLDHKLPLLRIVGIAAQVGKIVRRVGKSSLLVEMSLVVGFDFGC